jgi:hypothetical protein
MQFFVAHGVKGVYEEGNYYGASCDSEFAGLRAYLLARLLFNPDIDYEAEMDGFLRAYYGGGWQYIKESIRLICAHAGLPEPTGEPRRMGMYVTPTDKALLSLKPNQAAYADRLWARALELAGGNECRRNVLRSRLSWRFWKACNRVNEFGPLRWPGKLRAENERLYDDLLAAGVTQYRESFGGVGALIPPGDWKDSPLRWKGEWE